MHLRSTLALCAQQLVQARHGDKQAVEIATNQMEARIQMLALVVQLREQNHVVQACVLLSLWAWPTLPAVDHDCGFPPTQLMVFPA